MPEFVKRETTGGYCSFSPLVHPDLTVLKKFDYLPSPRWKQDDVEIQIGAVSSLDQPTVYQVKTLNFIVENQNEILGGIFDYYQKVILPVYKDMTDIEDNRIAHNSLELPNVFGIRSIEIPYLEEYFSLNESLYFFIRFAFEHDVEHGLFILFRDAKPIDASSELVYDVISMYEDDGGLKNSNGEPLKVRLRQLNGNSIFQNDCYFDEKIQFSLEKGTYSAHITCTHYKIERLQITLRYTVWKNFYLPKDVEILTLRELLTMD